MLQVLKGQLQIQYLFTMEFPHAILTLEGILPNNVIPVCASK